MDDRSADVRHSGMYHSANRRSCPHWETDAAFPAASAAPSLDDEPSRLGPNVVHRRLPDRSVLAPGIVHMTADGDAGLVLTDRIAKRCTARCSCKVLSRSCSPQRSFCSLFRSAAACAVCTTHHHRAGLEIGRRRTLRRYLARKKLACYWRSSCLPPAGWGLTCTRREATASSSSWPSPSSAMRLPAARDAMPRSLIRPTQPFTKLRPRRDNSPRCRKVAWYVTRGR